MMDHPVEVASFHRGELQSVRILSPKAERRAVGTAAAVASGFVGVAMTGALAVASAIGLVLHAPTFFGAWGAVAGGVAYVAARRVRARARRYRVGVEVEADAFAPMGVDLVRRDDRGGYELSLLPGMSGVIETGRSAVPVEALVEPKATSRVPVPAEGAARIELGASTFVVRRVPESTLPALGEARDPRPDSAATVIGLAGGAIGKLGRIAAAGVPLAAVATLLGSAPRALAVSEAEMRSAIPATATPWQTEQMLRAQAQRQVDSLHACFDLLPSSCQKSGYVGVGLGLGRDGEVREHWVSRSTYGYECPVGSCIAKVVSGWYFEPLPSPMRLVLPVQVIRRGGEASVATAIGTTASLAPAITVESMPTVSADGP